MVLGLAERYSIEKRDDRVVLLMKQGVIGVRVGVVCAVVLAGTWWIGPYGPQTIGALRTPDVFYWIWSGFFTIALPRRCSAPLHPQRCRDYRRRGHCRVGRLRVEVEPADFAWTAAGHLGRETPDPRRRADVSLPRPLPGTRTDGDAGLFIELQRKASVDRLLDALRSAIMLDVRGLPSRCHIVIASCRTSTASPANRRDQRE